MSYKNFIFLVITINVIKAQQTYSQLLGINLMNDLITSESGIQLKADESSRSVVVGGGEGIIGNKVIDEGLKHGIKNYESGGKKFGKRLGQFNGKKYYKKAFKKGKKLGAFSAAGKGFRRFGKKKAFNKLAAEGFRKKFVKVKTFSEDKGFKFGKLKGYKANKGIAKGIGYKRGKFYDFKAKGLGRKFRGGKKRIFALGGAKGARKLINAHKLGYKKEGEGLLKTGIVGKRLKKFR